MPPTSVPGPFVVHHGEVNTDADGPIEVCLPFSGSLDPVDDIRIRIEPAGVEAFTTITKREVEFPGILEAYDAVSAWVKENKKTFAGSRRAVYLADWDSVPEEDPAVDIAFPIS
ncbi:MAG: hypothetical protein OEM32_05835 [Acidimicrobiia bacterium]|nr:hypothetical protein [Acidimicrobiia bacterium]